MFKSPVTDTSLWTITPAFLTVPEGGTLRYPGYSLRAARFAATSAQSVVLPVKSHIKVITDGTNTLFELEPLLISNPDLAKKFSAGFPNIYIRFPGTVTSLTEGVEDAGFVLGDFSEFTFAIQISDRVERDISLAADLILNAMQGISEIVSWEAFCIALRPHADILFLDANGQSFSGTIRLRFISGSTTEDFDFIPGTTSLGQQINNREGILRLVNAGPVPNENCLWVNADSSGTATVSYGETAITGNTRIILFADLFNWFAPQSRSDQPHPIPRFSKGNRVTTLVNGPAFFKDLFSELNKAAIPGGRFFLAGYAIFQDDQFIITDSDVPKTILEATRKIVDAQGQCYYLPLQLFQLKENHPGTVDPEDVLVIAAFIALILEDIGIIFKLSEKQNANKYSTPVIIGLAFGGAVAIMLLAKTIVESGFVLDKIRNMSSSVDDLDYVNGQGKSRKIWALHPAAWEDNSYEGDGTSFAALSLAQALLPGVSAYHQKIAVVKNTDWVAWCGGIDLNPNRMDDERHMSNSPYHDVHARITGPAARDLAITFIDRWNDESPNDLISTNSADLPSVLPIPNEQHIVQVARTTFQANPVSGSNRAFSYAPTGDRTILDTILKAISSAKEYIYIEDQYFTPTPDYRAALLQALSNGLKSLVILMPNTPDQPYGETERAPFVEELLAMNDPANPRVRIGFSRRSYLLPPTTSEILKGRMMLGRDLTESDTEIVLGPASRQMVFPFWISVNGEIMLVTGKFPGSGGIPEADPEHPNTDNTYKTYQHYGVERGNATNFFDTGKGCKKRKHRAGTPATAVIYNGIYIHAKCMMIDDVFASIGSANMNRRGYHSDSEANIFFIPEPLRFTPSNPISALRKELWAELLNIPVEMGKNLLEDPVSASRLFDRDGSTGNRFIPYRAVSTLVKSFMNKLGNITITTGSFDTLETIKNTLSALALVTEGFDYDDVFFHISDPSSFSQNPHES